MAGSPSSQANSAAAGPALLPVGAHDGKPAIELNRPVMLAGSRHSARLHLVSRTVSKAHALFVNGARGTYVRDLASRTGIYVNDKQVREAELNDGDEIKIGNFAFRFICSEHRSLVDPQPAPPAVLEVDGADRPIPVVERVVLIGRRSGCDIPLVEESASTCHAVIFEGNGRRFVRDLGSRTGTFLNGRRIHQEEIKSGDKIRCGETDIHYILEESAEATSAEAVEPLQAPRAAEQIEEPTPETVVIAPRQQDESSEPLEVSGRPQDRGPTPHDIERETEPAEGEPAAQRAAANSAEAEPAALDEQPVEAGESPEPLPLAAESEAVEPAAETQAIPTESPEPHPVASEEADEVRDAEQPTAAAVDLDEVDLETDPDVSGSGDTAHIPLKVESPAPAPALSDMVVEPPANPDPEQEQQQVLVDGNLLAEKLSADAAQADADAQEHMELPEPSEGEEDHATVILPPQEISEVEIPAEGGETPAEASAPSELESQDDEELSPRSGWRMRWREPESAGAEPPPDAPSDESTPAPAGVDQDQAEAAVLRISKEEPSPVSSEETPMEEASAPPVEKPRPAEIDLASAAEGAPESEPQAADELEQVASEPVPAEPASQIDLTKLQQRAAEHELEELPQETTPAAQEPAPLLDMILPPAEPHEPAGGERPLIAADVELTGEPESRERRRRARSRRKAETAPIELAPAADEAPQAEVVEPTEPSPESAMPLELAAPEPDTAPAASASDEAPSDSAVGQAIEQFSGELTGPIVEEPTQETPSVAETAAPLELEQAPAAAEPSPIEQPPPPVAQTPIYADEEPPTADLDVTAPIDESVEPLELSAPEEPAQAVAADETSDADLLAHLRVEAPADFEPGPETALLDELKLSEPPEQLSLDETPAVKPAGIEFEEVPPLELESVSGDQSPAAGKPPEADVFPPIVEPAAEQVEETASEPAATEPLAAAAPEPRQAEEFPSIVEPPAAEISDVEQVKDEAESPVPVGSAADEDLVMEPPTPPAPPEEAELEHPQAEEFAEPVALESPAELSPQSEQIEVLPATDDQPVISATEVEAEQSVTMEPEAVQLPPPVEPLDVEETFPATAQMEPVPEVEPPPQPRPAPLPPGVAMLGTDQANFLGGMPLNLGSVAPPPAVRRESGKAAPAPPAGKAPKGFEVPPVNVTSPAQADPFAPGVRPRTGGDLSVPPFPGKGAASGEQKTTPFDGLAMHAVRTADVFSGLPAAQDDPVLGGGRLPYPPRKGAPPPARREPPPLPAPPAQEQPSAKPEGEEADSRRPLWRPAELTPYEAPPRPRRRWVTVFLLVLMISCMAGAAAAIYTLMPRVVVEGALQFKNLEHMTVHQRRRFETEQKELLNDEKIQRAAKQQLLARHPKLSPGFLDDLIAYRRSSERSYWSQENRTALVFRHRGADADGDSKRLSAVIAALYEANQGLLDEALRKRQRAQDIELELAKSRESIERLKGEIEEARQRYSARPAPQVISDLETEVAKLEQAWTSAVVKVKNLEGELERLQSDSEAAPAAAQQPAADAQGDVQIVKLQEELDTLTTRILAARDASGKRAEQARKTLDDALEAFQQHIAAAKEQTKDDPMLAGYLSDAQKLREATRQLTSELIQRQQEQYARLSEVKRRLDQKMEQQRNDAWASDKELKDLNDRLSLARRQYNTAMDSGMEKEAAELKAQLELLNGMVKARQTLLGDDGFFADTIASLQRIIETTQKGMDQDRDRVEKVLAQMQQGLVDATPEAQQMAREHKPLSERTRQLMEQMDRARREYATAMELKNVEANAELKELETSASVVQSKIDSRHRELAVAAKPAPAMESPRLAALQAELATAKEAEATARETYFQRQKDLRALQGELADARAAGEKMDQLMRQRDEKEKELGALAAELQKLRPEADHAVEPLPPTEASVLVRPLKDLHLYTAVAWGGIVLVFGTMMLVSSHRSRAADAHARRTVIEASEKPIPDEGDEDEQPLAV